MMPSTATDSLFKKLQFIPTMVGFKNNLAVKSNTSDA